MSGLSVGKSRTSVICVREGGSYLELPSSAVVKNSLMMMQQRLVTENMAHGVAAGAASAAGAAADACGR